MEGFVGKPSAIPAAKAFRGRRAEIRMRLYRARLISLVMLHRRMETVFLELVHIMLRFLKALARQNAFALFMNLKHMKFRFLARPSKNPLEHVSNVIHVIDWVIPADHQITGLKLRFFISFLFLDSSGLQFRGGCLRHTRKVRDRQSLVECVGSQRRDEGSLLLRSQELGRVRQVPNAQDAICGEMSEHSPVQSVEPVLF